MSHEPDDKSDAPQQLANDLRDLFPRDVTVPADVDHQILANARRRLSRRRRIVVFKHLIAAAAAAAAAIAVVYFLGLRPPSPLTQPEPLAASVPADVDGNGRVDILDAFALARRIKASEPLDDHLDLNGDGVVDARDVDLIAHAAVKL